MNRLRIALTSSVLVACMSISSTANATLALIFGGTGALSYVPATALGGSAAVAKDPITGRILAGGAVVIGIADPPAATYYNGSILNHYDPTLMQLTATGWLGSWGANSSLLAPPVDQSMWTNPQPLNLQGPNASLSTTFNDSVGIRTTTFDWGLAGHEDLNSASNIFAAVFTLTQAAEFTFLGDAPNGQPPLGANFYVSTPGVFCSLPNETIVQSCGEQTTGYYRVNAVPEPSIVLLLVGAGLVGLFTSRRRLRRE